MDGDLSNNLRGRVLQLAHGKGESFGALAMEIYEYQRKNNGVYRRWVEHMGKNPDDHAADIMDCHRLHISAWKYHNLVSGSYSPEVVYTSSGTSSSTTASHYVLSEDFYLSNTVAAFEHRYGAIKDTCILGLLPSYLERRGSSLVAMVEEFISRSGIEHSGTYLHDFSKLHNVLHHTRRESIPTVLLGVSFGLLDFVEQYSMYYPELVVMETGGMKGRRKEITRAQLHEQLRVGFAVEHIHSEYGMTELLSQAYSSGGGLYHPSATMQVVITELNDPMTVAPYGKAGVINVIDLANIDSCSFLMTEDVGIGYEDGTFEVLGRLDASDMRGCNLMVTDI